MQSEYHGTDAFERKLWHSVRFSIENYLIINGPWVFAIIILFKHYINNFKFLKIEGERGNVICSIHLFRYPLFVFIDV